MRKIEIYLDGQKKGSIGNGESKEFDIEPGEHRVEAKIDWCSSLPVSVVLDESEEQELLLTGFKFGKWLAPATLILAGIYFAFTGRLHFDPWMVAVLFLLPVLYFTYYLTLGRHKYLRLKKV